MGRINTIQLETSDNTRDIYLNHSGTTQAVFVGNGNNSLDVKLNLIVTKPGITHLVLIKSVLWDHSNLDIEAKLIIKKGAKNTDTYLKIACLVMSEHANVRAIPGLEIMEDAVKSGHGATVSAINENQVLYLQSRGLSRRKAEELIAEGFLK